MMTAADFRPRRPWAVVTATRAALVALVLLALLLPAVAAAQNRVFYAGGAGREVFRDVHRLSDGSVLIAGQAQNLDWIPASVPRVVLPATGLQSASQGNIGFILHVDGDFGAIRRVVHWPAGTARDVFKIRSTEMPGSRTGTIVISGSRDGASVDGYYLAELVGNGVDAPISGVAWVYNVRASGGHKERQPWDVGSDGRVAHVVGQEFSADWAAIEMLDGDGRRAVVEEWHAHWHAGGEWNGTPASSYTNAAQPLLYSAIVMKAGRRGSLRSTTAADFALTQIDANGNAGRRGRFPDDYYHAGPCALAGTDTCPSTGPGYTGYRAASARTQRVGGIAINRADNSLFFGYSTQSVLPDGNPDFEPAIVAMAADGRLRWWDRGYRETAQNSPPDQYIDGLAVDPWRHRLVVLGRTHGNAANNFWRGNELRAPMTSAGGFQNQFTGTNGNIHVSWLGVYRAFEGLVEASTYVAEFVEGPTNFGAPLGDAFFGGWPDPNRGWPDVNTTRCGADSGYSGEIAISPATGDIAVLCVGRRAMTTIDAHQPMPRPNVTPYETGAWSEFVRVYAPDLSSPRYSSLLSGAWNRSTGAGGDNTDLIGLDLWSDGVRVVGRQRADASNVASGNPVPTAGVPAWGAGQPAGESALAARLLGTRIGGQELSTLTGPEWVAAPTVIATSFDRGHADVPIAGLPATSDLRFEAFGPVAPLVFNGTATADPTPDDPFDLLSGTALYGRTFDLANVTQRRRLLIEVTPVSGSVQLIVGLDPTETMRPDANQARCRSTGSAVVRCDVEVTQEPGARARWWALVQSRGARVDFRIDVYEVPVDAPNADARLAATSAPFVSAGAAQSTRLIWNVPTFLSGERRGGWLRVSSGSSVLGWTPVRIDRNGAPFPVGHALPLDADYTLALPASGSHERLYVDVPAGATELRVQANSRDIAATVHLARRPLLSPDSVIPGIATAPARSAAVAQANVEAAVPAVAVVVNPQPGRWYVTPTNAMVSPGTITLRASLTANAPRPRPGGYFNPERSGHGLFVYPAGDQWAALWYTYLQDGTPTWYYLQAAAPGANGHWRSPVFRSTWNGSANRLVPVGEATLVPNLAPTPGGFVFSYTLDGESGSEAFVDFGGSCPSIGGTRTNASGHWFDPARAGTGYSVQLFPNTEYFAAFVYDGRGVARFLDAQRNSLGSAVSALDLVQLTGFCPLCVRSGDPTRTVIGRLQRTVGSGGLVRITTDGAFVGAVPGRWTSDDTVRPLGGLQGCTP